MTESNTESEENRTMDSPHIKHSHIDENAVTHPSDDNDDNDDNNDDNNNDNDDDGTNDSNESIAGGGKGIPCQESQVEENGEKKGEREGGDKEKQDKEKKDKERGGKEKREKGEREKKGEKGRGKRVEMAHMTGRSKDHPSVLSALLPGSQIRDPQHRILVNTSTTRELVRFNIGGTIFETYRSTLHKLPHSPLADESFLQKHFHPDRKEYFFDRDPDVFGAILNYLRTGELHLPTKYCGPAVKVEMEFWGLMEDEIEECCWTSYSNWTTVLESLRKLEKDRKVHMAATEDRYLSGEDGQASKLRQLQAKAWTVINNPRSSLLAQVYSYVSLTLVVVSILSFILQTHEVFRVPMHSHTGLAAGTTDNHSSQHTINGQPASSLSVTDTVSRNLTNVTKPGASDVEDDVHPVLLYVDAVCLVYFLCEFAMRLWLSPRHCKLLLLPMTIFELLALLPDLIEFSVRLFQSDLSTMSAVDVITFLRLLRVFRIFRLMRHFPGLWILFYTLKASLKELLLLLMFLCVGMLFFASLIYYTDDRTVFTSIPMACWWSIVTMTTVGYGDMYPKTQWGYVVGSMTAVCGVLVIGFTVPVLVNNFILYYNHTQSALHREGAKNRRAEARATKRDYVETA